YGLVVGDGAPWLFYAVLPLFFIGFVLIPGSLGAMACLALVNWMPRHLKQVLILVIASAVTVFVVWSALRLREAATTVAARQWFDNLFAELSFFGGRLVPFQWMAQGLVAAARGETRRMVWNLALVWSNGLFLLLLTVWLGNKLFRRGLNRIATGGTLRRRYGGQVLDALCERVLFFLDVQTRLLFVKDFRTFRRDPAQWAQILIFMGLGALYFINMRRFYERDLGGFKNGISLLTLLATTLLTCAYTGRFIFPLLSLEGRKFWILGLLPLDRQRLLFGKFAFAALGSVLGTEMIVIFSDMMLGMPWQIVLVHAVVDAAAALGLSGLSVGLGAMMPNFRETDPSKIAIGFGGTLNLLAGLVFVLVAVTVGAVPFHVLLVTSQASSFDAGVPTWAWCLTATALVFGLLVAVVPLRRGAQRLRAMEF
ncbi:MAG: hypothetical protein NZO58_13570, partial [Gemmataceae bacterium]|nr:hypothetical protein [Gemmataceae bacterium]